MAVADAKKNVQRLGRIFRKAPTAKGKKLSTRDWHDKSDAAASQGIEENFGVSMSTLKKIVDGLTEEERVKAALGEDPTPLAEAALQRRMEKFGTTATQVAAEGALAPVDEAALKRRMEKFGTTATAVPDVGVMTEAIKKRMERFCTAAASASATPSAVPAPPVVDIAKLSPEDQALLERRAQRFA